MRLLFLSNDFPSPWLPTKGTFNFELARALGRQNDVQVVAPIPWINEFNAKKPPKFNSWCKRVETRDGIRIQYPTYYYTPKFGRLWYDRFLWQSLRSTLQKTTRHFRPEAVIGYWTHPDGTVAVKYARQIGAAAFVMVGGSDVLVQARESPRRRRLIAETLRAADGVFAVSDDIRRHVIELGVPAERVHLAYRGVDRQQFSPGDQLAARSRLGVSHKLPLFLWVGRMEPVKGLEVLVQAAGKLRQQGSAFELALVGDGSERNRLAQSVSALGLDDTVRLTGPVDHSNLPDWYRAADWTVLSSRSEGVPNVLLESHACGTPFIATRVGGIPEIAVAGVDRIVPPSNPEEFAEQMGQALLAPANNPEQFAAYVSGLDTAATTMSDVIRSVVVRMPVSQRPLAKSAVRSARVAWQPAKPAERQSPWRQIARRMMSAVLPRRMFLTDGPEKCQQVCLTFDDGPHPVHTPRLLDVLEELGIKATFFVIGRNAEQYPQIVQRIVDEGHVLGNHTWSHPALTELSSRELAGEVYRTRKLIAKLTGMETRLFRPPLGKLTARQFVSLWGLQQTVVLWNSDPKDYQCRSSLELRGRLLDGKLRQGDLILMHDNQPFAADVLPELAARVRARGMTFASVADWICTQVNDEVRMKS
jgi:peptidoglycan/xylan/chitin deacetylase (PgdA/CDA1 family)/glycosyltransferase involved in cell wall biosynthesis